MGHRFFLLSSFGYTGHKNNQMNFRRMLLLCFLVNCLPCAWGTVFVQWNTPTLPPASSLGVTDIVVAWQDRAPAALLAARKMGYRVYVETPLDQATNAATACTKTD